MKNVQVSLTILMLVCLINLVGCDDSNTTGPDFSDAAGSTTYQSGCKSEAADADPNQECIELSYNDDRTLVLRHINSGLNCCPDHFNSEITIEDGRITVNEQGLGAGCKCECLFDLEYTLVNVPVDEYEIEFIGFKSGMNISMSVNLNTQTYVMHCVDRDEYPWG